MNRFRLSNPSRLHFAPWIVIALVSGCGGTSTDSSDSSAAASTSSPTVTCSTTALGVVESFDLFTTGDVTESNTDVGGSVAIGGNANLTNYAAGSQLPPVASRLDLVVGGNLQFNGGSVPNGAGQYAGTASITGVSSLGGITKAASPIDFGAQQTFLVQTSQYIGGLTATGTVTNNYGTLQLTGTSATVNIFTLAAADLATANGLQITAPAGSSVIINVTGTSASASNFGFTFAGVDREHTVQLPAGADVVPFLHRI
jgi:choice-of-anchor A domain-containing protein